MSVGGHGDDDGCSDVREPTWQEVALNHEWCNQKSKEDHPNDLRYPAKEVAVAARRMESRYGNVQVAITQSRETAEGITLTIQIRKK